MTDKKTATDASPNMVRVAGDSFRQQGLEDIDVSVRDVMDTGFDDNAFDAVICNRLLHHYRSSATGGLENQTHILGQAGHFAAVLCVAGTPGLNSWREPRTHRVDCFGV